MSELPGQSGHALPVKFRPFRANSRHPDQLNYRQFRSAAGDKLGSMIARMSPIAVDPGLGVAE